MGFARLVSSALDFESAALREKNQTQRHNTEIAYKLASQQMSYQHQKDLEKDKTFRLFASNMLRSRDERKRRRASERARKSAAKLDLKRDRQRYIAADRAAAKAAKRERKRIVVQRGYY